MSESRFTVELRSEVAGNKLSGYGAVFNQYADMGSYLEQLQPNAFDAVLSDPASDVRSFWNHDSTMLLGRQSSGTLRLSVDSHGLAFELDLPKTSYANDVRELAARGDLTGMSFGFIPGEEVWGTVGHRDLRTHVSVAKLIEVSPVSLPAYPGTTVQLRSLEQLTTDNTVRSQAAQARARVHLPRGNN
ncbi:MAG: HK97 family phage prohead protease [Mycobacterium sp.]